MGDAHVANDVPGAAIHGYSRAEVDEFLRAAAVERSRLQAEIDDARARAGRARSAIGMHRVMVSMLLQTQRELTEVRLEAEARAEEIIAAAERDARESTRAEQVAAPVAPQPPVADGPATSLIDLGAPEPWAAEHNGVAQDGWSHGTSLDGASDAAAQDEYFDFLRGALADESPLGPNAE